MVVRTPDIGRHGRIDITFTSRRGKTVLGDAYCEVPFKITRIHPAHPSGIAHLILMHCTAGLFGGDSLQCDIHVERGARILITQQSATKVHPSANRPANLRTRIRVEAGGELHIYNDPIIPFAGSHLCCETSIELSSESRLHYWESFMAGRIGRGEAWQFDELSFETAVKIEGRLGYLERFRLNPKSSSPNEKWMMADFPYMGTGLSFDARTSDAADHVHMALPDAGVDVPYPGLVVVRALAARGTELYRDRVTFARLAGLPSSGGLFYS